MDDREQVKAMKIVESRKMLSWAVPKRAGFKGEAPGLYFHYYDTESEAEKARRWLQKHKKFTGPVQYRPQECWRLGAIAI